jgi:hypothetical protein
VTKRYLLPHESTTEYQGDDTASHVLVGAGGEAVLDLCAGLFLNLTSEAFLDRLVEFEDAPGAPSGRCHDASRSAL